MLCTIEYIRSCETEAVANHSIRSFLFAAMLAEHQRPRPAADFDPDLVWEAIALHTSPGLAERRGALAHLTRAGIGMDFGRGSSANAARMADEPGTSRASLPMGRVEPCATSEKADRPSGTSIGLCDR
ncbi:MAG TPA: hypothetical protein VN969_14215 [Streptosporangiaceae bacterium]|nr:hypothetical protein [Streptosporangiaceae bacterium]